MAHLIKSVDTSKVNELIRPPPMWAFMRQSHNLGLNFLKCPKSRHVQELTADIVSFSYINVSQGSVATQIRRGGIFNNAAIANFTQSVPVEEFSESVNIWRRYRQKFGGMFLDSRCIISYSYCTRV